MAGAGHVLITDGQGSVEAIVSVQDAGDDIEIFEGLLTPGFVNTHCHLELSHLKGVIPEGGGLVGFVTQVMKGRNNDRDLILENMRLAEEELFNNGTVAVGDICNTADSIGIKENSRILWRNFIEVAGFSEEKAQERFAYGKKVLQEFQRHEKAGRATISPHAPYSVSAGLFGLINTFSSGEIITIHNQESVPENDLYLSGTGEMFNLYKNLLIDPSFFRFSGKTSLQSYLPLLNKAASLVLVHNSYTSQEDVSFAFAQFPPEKLFFCVCINANRYIESKSPPLELFRKNNCSITIGTDSYASNRQLNILHEIRTIQEESRSSIPLAEMLQWATLNGARALQQDAMLGSFEKGKKPGIVLIDKLENSFISREAKVKRLL
jgi:cytosine/adenosine deaminase-related metal-dependent hydrolase